MNPPRNIFIGTDSGATTSKIAGVWGNGEAITTKLLQRPTNAQDGTDAGDRRGWISAIGEFLTENNLAWAQVEGVGLAIPGPYQRYGVLDHSANLPPSFKGWDVYTAHSRALALQAGRELPLVVGNDGKCGGVAEARLARGDTKASVVMLMPGSGLGSAFVGANGLPLEGDTLAGMETAHMPAPLHLLGITGEAVPLWLRPRLGLHRSLYDDFRPRPFAGCEAREISRPQAGEIDGDREG